MLSAAILGSALHFLYGISGENPFAALIAPVNESTWEHLKLLFFPVLFLSVTEYWIRRPRAAPFFASRLAGILFGMLIIIVLFYLYTGLLHRDIFAADILIFLVSVCFTYVSSGHLYRYFRSADPFITFTGWLFLMLLFFSFTCFPPDLFLFYPPS